MIQNKINKKKGNSNIYAIILITILAISLFLFYSEKTKGYFKINSSQNETINIFVDNKDLGISEINKAGKIIKTKEGTHSVILSRKGYWPWATKINIIKQQTLDIFPFFVPQNSSGFIIKNGDPEYNKILSMFRNKTHINWEINKNTPQIIKNFKEEIRASDFYKNRNDVIIVAVQNGIYALEINSDSIPNFQPIYKGTKPTFVKKDNNTLYIKDGDVLMEVNY